MSKRPVYREDDHELLGYVAHDQTGWQAQTFFGFIIARTESERDAERIVRERGLSFLAGVWQYFDTDDKEWHTCVLKEANPTRVIVMRTNEMGYQDPDNYKVVSLMEPTDEQLIKIS